jgi:hypothetical protein
MIGYMQMRLGKQLLAGDNTNKDRTNELQTIFSKFQTPIHHKSEDP